MIEQRIDNLFIYSLILIHARQTSRRSNTQKKGVFSHQESFGFSFWLMRSVSVPVYKSVSPCPHSAFSCECALRLEMINVKRT